MSKLSLQESVTRVIISKVAHDTASCHWLKVFIEEEYKDPYLKGHCIPCNRKKIQLLENVRGGHFISHSVSTGYLLASFKHDGGDNYDMDFKYPAR